MSEKLIIKCWTKGEARIWTAHTFTSNAYKDIETELHDDAFYVSDVLNGAISEFETGNGRFSVKGEDAEYRGMEYEISIENTVSPKKITIVYNGTETVYEIISISV